MKPAISKPVTFQVVTPRDERAEDGRLERAVQQLLDRGVSLAGASINVYADAEIEAIELAPYTMRRLAQLGFTLMRLRPAR